MTSSLKLSVSNKSNASTSADYEYLYYDDFVCKVYDFAIEALFIGLLCAFGFVGNSLSTICLLRDESKSATVCRRSVCCVTSPSRRPRSSSCRCSSRTRCSCWPSSGCGSSRPSRRLSQTRLLRSLISSRTSASTPIRAPWWQRPVRCCLHCAIYTPLTYSCFRIITSF